MGDCDLSHAGMAFEGWRFTDWREPASATVGAVASREPVDLRLLDSLGAETAVQEMRHGANDTPGPARQNSFQAARRKPVRTTAGICSEYA